MPERSANSAQTADVPGVADHGNLGGSTQPHELAAFVDQASETLAAEYRRIRRRAPSDPGTAGDEGEGNWRDFLRAWVPPELAVVTKGRILGHKGDMSPQVDVLILRPGYPPALHGKNTYLAGGVLAAFECKLTLRRHHILEAAETARAVRRLISPRNGTPYGELHSPIIFGLLAHATALRRDPVLQIDAALSEALGADAHPRESLDAVCVENLAFWFSGSHVRPPLTGMDERFLEMYRRTFGPPEEGAVENYYMRWHDTKGNLQAPRPLYLMFERLIRRIAYEIELYRPVADYWRQAAVGGARSIAGRRWPMSILTKQSSDGIARGNGMKGPAWNPWHWND